MIAALIVSIFLVQPSEKPCEELCISAGYNGNSDWNRVDPVAFRDLLLIIKPYAQCYLENVSLRSAIVESGAEIDAIGSASLLAWSLCEDQRKAVNSSLSARLVAAGKSQADADRLAVQFRSFWVAVGMADHFKKIGMQRHFNKLRKRLKLAQH
ncbi:MAG: hypothetical protein K2X73_06890 [Sphingomonas sp.]|uniref:hypothetical protein n=1 Tax=Sphingomonas sp. TaxID=28214 RepID=UPI0025D58427|nr:hypothetical protein [Sphingomonas sp.]MBX9881684.1 hypothetical protein [Sphingomonas sp.]